MDDNGFETQRWLAEALMIASAIVIAFERALSALDLLDLLGVGNLTSDERLQLVADFAVILFVLSMLFYVFKIRKVLISKKTRILMVG